MIDYCLNEFICLMEIETSQEFLYVAESWLVLKHCLVPQAGIEPTTLALGVLCSVHLSYWGNQEIIPNSCFSP